jgi:hypothetical protein
MYPSFVGKKIVIVVYFFWINSSEIPSLSLSLSLFLFDKLMEKENACVIPF